MALTITSAVITQFSVAFTAAAPSSLSISYVAVDNAGNLYPGQLSDPLTPAQITAINTFAGGIVTQLETATGLNITLG